MTFLLRVQFGGLKPKIVVIFERVKPLLIKEKLQKRTYRLAFAQHHFAS